MVKARWAIFPIKDHAITIRNLIEILFKMGYENDSMENFTSFYLKNIEDFNIKNKSNENQPEESKFFIF